MPNSATLVQALGAAFCAILCALSGMGGGGMMIGARTAAWAAKGGDMFDSITINEDCLSGQSTYNYLNSLGLSGCTGVLWPKKEEFGYGQVVNFTIGYAGEVVTVNADWDGSIVSRGTSHSACRLYAGDKFILIPIK